MKKHFQFTILAAVASFSLTGSAFSNGAVPQGPVSTPVAAPAGCDSGVKNPYYVGLDAGIKNWRVRSVGDVEYIDVSAVGEFGMTAKKTRANGGLFAGYRAALGGCYVAGLELHGAFGDGKISKTQRFHAFSDTDLKITSQGRYTVTPSVLLGRNVYESFFIYGKLGVAITQFKTSAYKSADVNAADFGKFVGRSKNIRSGFAPALGLEYNINQNIALRTELGAVIYRTASHTYFNDDGGSIKTTVRVKPRYTYFRVGLMAKI
ncbi:MAG: outer membrane beta-barrel protein [Alphaproteobacteria bacterium]|nr:outer membrane beta-barrel protein [Alphaproteobacteria bacterium]